MAQISVFPREIAKRALHDNAAAAIFAHNHPSGVVESGRADESLTETLKHTLVLVEVKVLDHFVVGSETATLFAEPGLLQTAVGRRLPKAGKGLSRKRKMG